MPKSVEQFRSFLRSRHHVMSMLKTLALVVPLTILIWIYAERAQTAKDQIMVDLDVWINNPDLFATVIEPNGAPIAIELEGPRAKIQVLKTQLERRIRVQLNGTFQPDTEPSLSATALLNDYPEIRQSGVTVTMASPSTVKIHVDPRVKRMVPLLLPQNLPVAISSYSISPPSVEVQAPKRVWEKLFPTPQSGIKLDLSNFMERINTPGQHKLENVPLAIPREPGVIVSPSRANEVRLEVSAQEVEYVIRTIPVVIQQPLPTVNKWIVTTKEKTVTNLSVRGPAAEIRKIESIDGKPPEITPTAVLKLTNDDRAKTDEIRAVSIDGLPAGVTPSGNAPTIEFSVRDVPQPE